MTYLRSYVVAVVFGSSVGCGLISSDVTNFDLTLPDKSFTVDAAGWQVDQMAADAFLNTSCASSPSICMSAASNACPMNCTGECRMSTNRCELGLDVGVYKSVDLVSEKPELKSINDEPVIKVTIDSIAYRIPMNTLNVATPEMVVYVAPMSVMDPADPMAKKVGVIAPIPAMTTIGAAEMTYVDGGKQALIETMSTYKNPFNIIVGATVWLKAGDRVPTGRLDAVVTIKAHAGI